MYRQLELTIVHLSWNNISLFASNQIFDLVQSLWWVQKSASQAQVWFENYVVLRNNDGESPIWVFNFNKF